MVVHQVFAHILDNKIKNVIVCDNYEVANQLARSIYGQNAIAVECTQYPCGIGDFYIDNSFHYRDKDDPNKVGDPVPRKNTAEEDAFEANSKATVLQDDVAANTVDIEYLKIITGAEDATADEVTTEETATEKAASETTEAAE